MSIDIDGVIDKCGSKQCVYYFSNFYDKAKEMRDLGDLKAWKIYKLLGDVSSFVLNLEEAYQPFPPYCILRESRSAILDDLTDKDIDLLEQMASLVSDVDLRARICDVLWVKERNHQRGRQAIDLYIESFQVLRKDEKWVAAIERLRRAIQLSGFFRNSNEAKIVSIIEGTIEEYKELLYGGANENVIGVKSW